MRLLQRHNLWLLIVAAIATAITVIALSASHQPPPAVPQAAAPEPVPTVPQATPALDAKSATILELFNPSDASLTHQLNETELSQRIEQILVSSFVLVRCDLMDQDAYSDTFRALVVYTQHANLAADATTAEARVRHIAVSASTSYSLVYRHTKCSDPKLLQIAQQLKTWREAYLRQ